MKVAVAGGGVVGLFAAWHLERAGADVTLYEPGPLGAGSVHAAGIIEPTTAYRTNTVAFLRRVGRLWRNGTCRLRSADPHWLATSALQLEREPRGEMVAAMRQLSTSSVATYRSLAASANDFAFTPRGLIERFEDPVHFAEQKAEALAQQATAPVEVREQGDVGELYFPEVSWLDTERLVARLERELRSTAVVHQRVERVGRDGTVRSAGESRSYDAVVAATGVGLRRLGVPLTGVRGFGWHARTRWPVDVATILVDRGIAVVPFDSGVKVTGGWDFDLSDDPAPARRIRAAIERVVPLDEVTDVKGGARPCTPDGLPTIGRRGRLIVATGGFRLGWSFGPGMGEAAARLALGSAENDPFLSRYCDGLHDGTP